MAFRRKYIRKEKKKVGSFKKKKKKKRTEQVPEEAQTLDLLEKSTHKYAKELKKSCAKTKGNHNSVSVNRKYR